MSHFEMVLQLTDVRWRILILTVATFAALC